MSRLKFSSCFTRELVAMGRRRSRFAEVALDAFDDVFFGGSFAGSGFCVDSGSALRNIGPDFGALWLN